MGFIDVGPQLENVSFKDIIDPGSGLRHNDIVHVYNMPWTGNNGTSKNNAYRTGRITAPADPGSNGAGAINRFYFHYNPQSVTLSSQSDPTKRPADQMQTTETFGDPTALENMSFDFLLNRIPDVALHDGKTNASAQAYGTLHDLYYLYGLINRNFTDPIIKTYDYPNTNAGLLLPYPVVVIFGELFRFTGVVTGIGIQHAKFVASPMSTATSAPLIPVLTNVSLTLKRTLSLVLDAGSGEGDTSGGVLGPPTANEPSGTMPQTAPPSSGTTPGNGTTSPTIGGVPVIPGIGTTAPAPGIGVGGGTGITPLP